MEGGEFSSGGEGLHMFSGMVANIFLGMDSVSESLLLFLLYLAKQLTNE